MGSRCTDVKRWRRAVLASSLPATAKVIAIALHEHMAWSSDSEDAGQCWPGLRTIAEGSAMQRRSVIRALDALDGAGFIGRACRRGCEQCRGGNGHVTLYTATLPQRGHLDTAQRGHLDTASGDTSGVNGALSGVNGASQRGHGDTGTDFEQRRTERTKATDEAAAAACTRCSGVGFVLEEHRDVGYPCPDCQPDRTVPEGLTLRSGSPSPIGDLSHA